MSICPYDAFRLYWSIGLDVFRICDAITLFRQQLTTSTYILFTTSKRWQTAWRVILETVGYENLKDINDAKYSETSTSSRTRETMQMSFQDRQPVSIRSRVEEDTESKTVRLFVSNTQLSIFSIARSRNLVPTMSTDTQCLYQHHHNGAWKGYVTTNGM
jgi:hypothetical protein